MPVDKTKFKEISVRVPHELWDEMVDLFKTRHQESIPYNQMILTLIREALELNRNIYGTSADKKGESATG